MSKPNEWWMLRRAARHVVTNLWRSDELWSRPESIIEAYQSVKLIREIAQTIPDKPPKRSYDPWLYLGG